MLPALAGTLQLLLDLGQKPFFLHAVVPRPFLNVALMVGQRGTTIGVGDSRGICRARPRTGTLIR